MNLGQFHPICETRSVSVRSDIALEAGATAYLTKPVNWSLFADHIAHLLALGESRQAFEQARAQLEATQTSGRLLMELYAQELERAAAAGEAGPGRRDRLRQLGARITCYEDEAAQRVDPPELLRRALAERAAQGFDLTRVAVEGGGKGCVVSARPEAFGALVAEVAGAAALLSAGGADVRCGFRREGADVLLWVSGSGSVAGQVDEVDFALGAIGVLAALNRAEVACEAGRGAALGFGVRLAALDAPSRTDERAG